MPEATEDLFTGIHKGLRAMIYDLSGRLQTNDFEDLEASRRLTTDLEHNFEAARSAGCMICIFHHHAEDEQSFIFSAVHPTNGDLVSSLIEEHHGLAQREYAITSSAHDILGLPKAQDRVAAGVRLNQAMNGLLAAYVTHMNREETELVPHMRKHFTNEQMAAMRGQIIGGMAPDRVAVILGWMLPAMNVTELTDLFESIRPTAPPPMVAGMVKLCEARVDPARWKLVKSRLGM